MKCVLEMMHVHLFERHLDFHSRMMKEESVPVQRVRMKESLVWVEEMVETVNVAAEVMRKEMNHGDKWLLSLFLLF